MENTNGLEPLFPDRDSQESLSHQLARRLRRAIEAGFYKPLSRLPSSRDLAKRLGLSRNTVSTAIEQLIGEGFLESRVGSGTFVVAKIVQRAVANANTPHKPPASADRFFAVRSYSEHEWIRSPLQHGIPDLEQFPNRTWARMTRRKLAELSKYLNYGGSQGERSLRVAIAQHVQQFRGITVDSSQVMIVAGTQAALYLTADVLTRTGDTALIEDPCYLLARAAFQTRNLRLLPIDVDREGVNVEGAPAARLAYVTPSHQYPLAAVMSVERRRLLLAWAERHDAYIFEDDYDSEYSFGGKPLPALQSIDCNERVVYAGTFSKTLAPGLSIGYLIVPPHLIEPFSIAQHVSTLGETRFVQAALADFLSEGHFARHVRRMTRSYAERRRRLIDVFERSLPDRFTLDRANAGLHLAITGPPDFDDVAVKNRLAAQRVFVEPLSLFCVARTDCRGFIVGFSAADASEITEAAHALLRAIKDHTTMRV